MAGGRQEPAHGDVGNNRGRRSRTSDTAAAAFVVAGGAAAGTARCAEEAQGAEPR